jgi:hypothetical protein
MEPLSIVASAIAIVQAGDRIAGLTVYLRRLLEAGDEADEIINEVRQLSAILSSLGSGNYQLPATAARDLQRTISDCHDLMRAIEEIMQSVVIVLPQRVGGTKVQHLRWARHRTKILRLVDRLKEQKSMVTLQLGGLVL